MVVPWICVSISKSQAIWQKAKKNVFCIFFVNGGREKDDFIKYIAEHASEELKGFDRKGKAKKTEL